MTHSDRPLVGYFSMEIALHPKMPTYSGGLGILAGDTLRAAADLGVAMIGVTLLQRQGYFAQSLDSSGWQYENPMPWEIGQYCSELPVQVDVEIENRPIHVRAWKYEIQSCRGNRLPVILLDTDIAGNSDWDRRLTDQLYGGDQHYRLCQEIILGLGGVRILRALGHQDITRFHMNEGHAALLGLELLDESAQAAGRSQFNSQDVQNVRHSCNFTTHTPVPAGHDRFPLDLVQHTLARSDIFENHEVFCCEGELNMTYLALNLSHYVNGVARKHGEVSRKMLVPRDQYHHYEIDHITNGVHLETWAAPALASLFDHYLPGWREDNSSLRSALSIPGEDIWKAHQAAKQKLIDQVNASSGTGFDINTFTLGFARRATAYKRANLLFHDPARLKNLARQVRNIQVVFAGKAHPHDEQGKHLIQEIFQQKDSMLPEVKVVYLENYDWELARLLTSGVDVWLNTPLPPLEASGTSGMKAALNGVPSLSVLDGWWIEGCVEGVTGWAIDHVGESYHNDQERFAHDANCLYETLENSVIPLFYQQRDAWLKIMSHAIALNASYFNTQRMVQQYVLKAYYD